MKKQHNFTLIKILAFVGFVILLAILCEDLYPLLKNVISDADDESKMISYIDAYGSKGVFIIVGLQILSVLIPGMSTTPISILSGLCYGVIIGTMISSAAIVFINMIIYLAADQLKHIFSNSNISFGKKGSNLLNELIAKNKKPEQAICLAYLIPFIPNMIIPFFFSRKVSIKNYLLAMSAAVIPSTFLYSLIGKSVAQGNYIMAIIILIAIIVILIAFVLWNKFFTKESKKTPV